MKKWIKITAISTVIALIGLITFSCLSTDSPHRLVLTTSEHVKTTALEDPKQVATIDFSKLPPSLQETANKMFLPNEVPTVTYEDNLLTPNEPFIPVELEKGETLKQVVQEPGFQATAVSIGFNVLKYFIPGLAGFEGLATLLTSALGNDRKLTHYSNAGKDLLSLDLGGMLGNVSKAMGITHSSATVEASSPSSLNG